MCMSGDVRRKYNIFLKYKAHLLVWVLGTAAAQHSPPPMKKHPGVCKCVVGVSAYPDSLTY